MEEEASWGTVRAGRTLLEMMLMGFRPSHRVGTGQLNWHFGRASSLMNMRRHGTQIQILENESSQLATEDSHSVASFAKSADQVQTWMAGSNLVHFHSSVRCCRCQILPFVEDGSRQDDYSAVFSIYPERYDCARVVGRIQVPHERRRRPGRKACSPRGSSDHLANYHVQTRRLEVPCHWWTWRLQRLPQDPFSRLSRAFSALAHTHN
jgi:hypothetical protein